MNARILVAYDHPQQLQTQLQEALPLAARLAADVVVLRVNLPRCESSRQAQCEQLYSELKGLQAQLPDGRDGVRIFVESHPGPAEQAIFEYAEQHSVSLILSPHLTTRQTAAPDAVTSLAANVTTSSVAATTTVAPSKPGTTHPNAKIVA